MPALADDSQQRLDLALELLGHALWEWHPVSEQFSFTPAWAAQLGKTGTPPPLSLDDFALLCHEAERDIVRRMLAAGLTGSQAHFELRYRLRHSDGGWRWFRSHARLQRDAENTLQRVIGLQADISVEMQRDAAMADTLGRYLSLYDKAPLAIVVWDREGRITDWNPHAAVMFGHPRDAVIGRHFINLLLRPQDHDAASNIARALIRDGVPSREATINLAADGRQLFCDWQNVPQRNARGTVTGVLSLIQDNTERWHAERERARDEARNRALIETSPDAIFLLDTHGTILNVNHSAVMVLHADDSSDLIGTHAGLWVDETQCEEFLHNAIDNPDERVGFIASREFSMLKADNEHWLADIKFTTLADDQGLPTGIVLFARDITEMRRNEAELEDYRMHLEALVDERTTELQIARRQAEGAAKTKAEFLANMSHEIRTPLNALLGLAHLTLRTPLNPRQRDYIERIKGAGGMLLGLLNDVLDLSKIEAGRLSMEATEFVLDDVLDSVATMVGGRAREKALQFHFLVAADVPQDLLGDPLRLSQVLINLCGNAIKFTETGHVVVRVVRVVGIGRTAAAADDSTERLHFVIEDSGIGLSEEQAARLFQAFSQADTSTTRKFGGTGLGLIISQRIVELMQGRITLDSTPGVGSRFQFEASFGKLPRLTQHAEKVPAAWRGANVVLIDADALSREALSASLQTLQLRVTACASCPPTSALEAALSASGANLLLADASLPGVLEAVSALTQHPAAPRIVLLARGDTDLLEAQSVHRGIDDIIITPLTLKRLLRLLQALAGETPADSEMVELAPAHLAGQRILLADDIATNRLIATEMLTDWGLRVESAEDGQEALEKLLATPADFALILMDLQMPRLDGIEATRRIRAAGHTLPIVAMTAHTLHEERDRCLLAGMNDFVSKPIDPPLLLATLVRHISGKAENAALLRPVQAVPPLATARTASFARPPSCLVASSAPSSLSGEPVRNKPLPFLPGINTAIGITRVGGKPSFYERILRDCLLRFDGADRMISNALATGNVAEAERQAHSVKGLAASIGAEPLSDASATLELAIRQGNLTAPALDRFGSELSLVVAGLRAAYPA